VRLKRSDPLGPSEEPRFISVPQVARRTGMSAMTIYRAIAAGEFPAVRIRGRLIVPVEVLDAMANAAIAEQTVVDASFWVPEPRPAKEA
jgi:excisionase family DNA binding protein